MQKLLQINCPDVRVIATFNDPVQAVKFLSDTAPDIIFLDIVMPEMSGLELLKALKDISSEVIFITAHNQYMIDAFHFSALDYLLKPVEDNLLRDAVARARKKIQWKAGNKNVETFVYNLGQQNNSQKQKLCIPTQKGFQVVSLEDIIHITASGNYSNIYFLNNKSECTTKPINEYESLLQDVGFVRIHKSCIVNIMHVKEYRRGEGGVVRLTNGQEMEVSRRKKDLLITKIREHFKY